MTDVAETGVYNSRYEIIRQIARGGMAEVYLARDLQLHRSVALKVLFRELSTDKAFVQRFRHEAQAAANLSHPNIVSVYDWGESEADNTYFMVMEYVDGDPLSKIIRTRGPLDPHRAAEIGADIAAGLAYAHSHGVIHRDVKPGNVLITGEGVAKVTDFGIARGHNTDASLTQTGAVMGTATYFSPEQAQGEHVDSRSDLYSLAVVLYEMVTGKPPFSGDNPIAIATKHVRETPTPPTDLDPTIPEDFEAIVMKAMAKSPDERYPTAEALHDDLTHFVDGRHVSAPAFDPSVTTFYEGAAATTIVSPRDSRTRVVRPAAGAATPPGGGPGGPGGGPPPEAPRRTGARIVGLVLALIAAAGLLGIGTYAAVRNLGTASGSSFDVPNLVGMSLQKAESKLRNNHLDYKIDFAQSDKAPGTVVTQSPAYPTPVSKGDTVVITVSKGGEAAVPSVIGLSQSEAAKKLKDAGFYSQEVSRPITCSKVNALANVKGNGAIGTVIEETPSGSARPLGSTVTITVSKGVAVPNVADGSTTETQAAGQLGQCGFTIGTTTLEPEPAGQTIPSGFVISTDPAAGSFENPGTTVNLTVSTGAGIPVPPVVGETLGQAEQDIQSKNLAYSVKYTPATASCKNGVVCSQSPDAGTVVNNSSNVTLTVGQTVTTTSTSSTTSTSTTSTTSTTVVNQGG